MGTAHLERGERAEAIAAAMLEQAGYRILDRNVRYPCGEIDLVVQNRNGQDIVFVEVRFRRSPDFGGPLASVHTIKQRRLQAAAQLWLQQNDRQGRLNCRFDVIGFCGNLDPARAEWIENALEGS